MTKNRVPINDMHAHVTAAIDMERPNGNDPYFLDSKPTYEPVVDAIVAELDLKPIKGETMEPRYDKH